MFDQSSDPGPPVLSDDGHPGDVVSELLLGMRLFGIQYRRMQFAPPFGVEFAAAAGRAQFHFIARGTAFLRTDSGALHRLRAGDAVLLPHGRAHELLSDPERATRDIASFDTQKLCETVCAVLASGEVCDHSNDALIFSGCMAFDLGGMHTLVTSMPEVMRVDTLLDRYPEILPMLEAMARESCEERAGYAGILARLADVVSAFIVRGWVECGCGDAKGWVEALRDPRLGRAIVAMHREPGRDWTVAELAERMGSSRSVFAERFLAVTGMTPVRYLTELRMRLAAQWLRDGRMSIEGAAYELGYGSQAAFSRAFKRIVGHTPGAARGVSLPQ
ncbi:AraC family transcriptional regulator [Bordetella genomosp. 9]|uniref:AraC family transcriptional regulator n=1 Tax=Bordetella genomosp. 9 TaxID=1416803 RepID=A0A261R7Z2_9BORD|nr:AraC family transcriptional regulator [Bordetella genomosp. 9]OZI21081.1 AraC family transcriptional regulator [Bordetella genomosp. 9]